MDTKDYEIQIYVQHGYFSYSVSSMEKAIAHGEVIMSSGVYRSGSLEDEVTFHKVYKVKVKGPNLKSQYVDTFNRT